MGRIESKFRKTIFFNRLAVCLLLFAFVSCKTSKKHSLQLSDKSDFLESYADKYLYLNDHFFSFESMSAKFSVHLESISLNGQIRIKKDSILWISLTKFIEVARVKLTPDSVFIYNKIQNQYFAGNYSLLKSIFPADIDYYMLQSLFTGNDLLAYNKSEYSFFKKPEDSLQIGFFFKNRPLSKTKHINQLVTAEKINGKILSNILQFPELITFQVVYDGFVNTQGGMFPTKQQINAQKDSMEFGMEVVFEQPVLNKQQTYPFSIPGNASPMALPGSEK